MGATHYSASRNSSRWSGCHRQRPQAGAPKAFDKAWINVLQNDLGAWKHAEFGLGTHAHAGAALRLHPDDQQRHPDQLPSYKLRLAQDLTLYLREIGLDIDGSTTRRASGTGSRIRSGRARGPQVETIMGATDYLEQYFAINVVFEPLVGELVRSGFFIPVGAANNDLMTPSVVSAAEADYERNLANTVDLIYLQANDPTYGGDNRALFQRWLATHADLAEKAAGALQPLWSKPHSKPISFQDARSKSHERFGQILGELGLKQ